MKYKSSSPHHSTAINKITDHDSLPEKGQDVLVIGEKPEEIAVAHYNSFTRYNGTPEWQLLYIGGYAGDGDMDFKPTHWIPLEDAHKALYAQETQ